ncbi:MAG: dihydrofolate reductase [Patescibacteria group bacterium]
MKFSIIVAIDKKRGIGIGNQLPWHIPEDSRYFHKVSIGQLPVGQQNAAIMGRKTWESLPAKGRPMPERYNVVITRDSKYELPKEVGLADSLDKALKLAAERDDIADVFIVGGGSIYKEAISHPDCHKLYITKIDKEYPADTFFPEIPADFKLTESSAVKKYKGIRYQFNVYSRE